MISKVAAALSLVGGVLGKPLESRAVTDFTVYAYGPDGIGGFPIIAIDGE